VTNTSHFCARLGVLALKHQQRVNEYCAACITTYSTQVFAILGEDAVVVAAAVAHALYDKVSENSFAECDIAVLLYAPSTHDLLQ
jgi:hypothetical protein